MRCSLREQVLANVQTQSMHGVLALFATGERVDTFSRPNKQMPHAATWSILSESSNQRMMILAHTHRSRHPPTHSLTHSLTHSPSVEEPHQ
jgi:hypothetical protein